MIRFSVVSLIFFVCSFTSENVEGVPEEKYTTKYDYVDWDAIVNSPRLIRMYLNCLLDKGVCNPEGKEFKKNLPDALTTGCSKCSPAQRKGVGRVLKFPTEQKPEWYKEVKDEFDPNGESEKKYLKKLIEDAEKM